MGSSAILPGRIGKFRGSAIQSWRNGKLGGGHIFGTLLFDGFTYFGTYVLVIKAQGGCITYEYDDDDDDEDDDHHHNVLILVACFMVNNNNNDDEGMVLLPTLITPPPSIINWTRKNKK